MAFCGDNANVNFEKNFLKKPWIDIELILCYGKTRWFALGQSFKKVPAVKRLFFEHLEMSQII